MIIRTITTIARRAQTATPCSDRGQTTAEYALVILGAAAVAVLVLAWAAETGKVSTLLNKVVDSVAGNIT